jgi:hypothetical protein
MRATILGVCVLGFLLASCASTPTDRVISEQKIEFSPELQFSVGQVSSEVSSSELEGKDVQGLMSEAMRNALREAGVEWAGDTSQGHAIINLRVLNYQPGNAFARWMMPGAGATVLAVDGSVVDPASGEVLAQIRDERGIYAGGAYTIGGWRTIFSTVAEDIVAGLKGQAKGKGFVVHVDAWLKRDLDIPAAAERRTYVLEKITDNRPEKGRIGERFAAFGVSMGDVYFFQPVTTYVRDMVADDLRAAGHSVTASGEGYGLSLDIDQFWITTKTTALYWDIVADVQLTVRLAPTSGAVANRSRQFSCHATERTYVWPTEALFIKTLDACLVDLMGKLRADPIWQQD